MNQDLAQRVLDVFNTLNVPPNEITYMEVSNLVRRETCSVPQHPNSFAQCGEAKGQDSRGQITKDLSFIGSIAAENTGILEQIKGRLSLVAYVETPPEAESTIKEFSEQAMKAKEGDKISSDIDCLNFTLRAQQARIYDIYNHLKFLF